MSRFYPDVVPSFADEPTWNKFSIVPAADRGEGIIAVHPFKAGTMICRFTGFIVPKITLYSLRIGPESHIHDPYFMGKLLHSCEPNIHVNVNERQFWAVRDIEAGEFLTMDYESTEAILYRTFVCQCGSSRCRKEIAGYAAKG